MQYTISSNETPLSVMSRAFLESSHMNGLFILHVCIILCALWQHIIFIVPGPFYISRKSFTTKRTKDTKGVGMGFDPLSNPVPGCAIEVHRVPGPGLKAGIRASSCNHFVSFVLFVVKRICRTSSAASRALYSFRAPI
jgi:hypothetical protein